MRSAGAKPPSGCGRNESKYTQEESATAWDVIWKLPMPPRSSADLSEPGIPALFGAHATIDAARAASTAQSAGGADD
ncbi:hypothetical protein [Paraburkholderia sp. CNPSo 3281]|uniref:hypothetical protein n=1 Tax=Paraburkholderia sp. CNPSo 3281 TaxID=2940933 RepID=UPI0020B7A5FE|nr:hypothetical protein [Paraburkholderia sp. CNPSo 3281]MCP3716796.1 hypothetical protein [Paraburkholderia sp. CNPSo 3281]